MATAEQLLEFKSRLKAAQERREAAASEVKALEQIVAALQSLAVAEERGASVAKSLGAGRLAGGSRRKRAPRGLPGVVREFLSDGEERSLDEIEQFVAYHPRFKEHVPTRGSISNRLNEFVGTGYLVRPSPTSYKLASGGRDEES